MTSKIKFNSLFSILMLLIASTKNCQAQLQGRYWVGLSHIDFLTTPPTSVFGASAYSCAIGISDAGGNFLFGSDGGQSLTKFLGPMPNGNLSTTSHEQSFICPFPGNIQKYFLFTHSNYTFSQTNTAYNGGLVPWRYAIIDMSLNAGLGDVISANNVVTNNGNYKLAGIGICNGAEYWVVNPMWASDTFCAYRITGAGIAPAIKSKSGNTNGIVDSTYIALSEGVGQLRFAANGNYIANARSGPNGTIEVHNFNKLTGQISLLFTDTLHTALGCSFSPDCSKLYATGSVGLVQYNMNAGSIAAIKNSRQLIQATPTLLTYTFGHILNAINGKMYVRKTGQLLNSLATIDNPNNSGAACNYSFTGPLYNPYSSYWYGLPNILENFTIVQKDTAYLYYTNCQGNDSIFFKSPYIESTANFNWNFGDVNSGVNNTSNIQHPTHIFTDTGTYNVQLIVYNNCGADTIIKTVFVDSIPKTKIIPDQLWNCKPGANNAIQAIGAHYYNWLPNTNINCDSCASIIAKPNTTTNYTVTGTSPNGCELKDTIALNIIPLNAFVVSTDSICELNNFNATSLSTGANISWQWVMGDGSIKNGGNPITHSYKAGTYQMNFIVQDTLGCIDTVTKNIFVDQQNSANFTISDSVICVGEPIIITDSVPDNTKILYSFGDGTTKNIKNPIYSYEQAGVFNITLDVDNIICNNTSSNKPITVNNYPIVNLGADTNYCPGYTGPITFTVNGNNILWSNGSTNNNITVTEPNTYFVTVTSINCENSDTIKVVRDCYLNVPNSFTPNNDGLNDYFMPMDLVTFNMQNFEMQVFNRWGEMVFKTNNINGQGWDGKFGNKQQPMGVYVYHIKATFKNGNGEIFTGNVTLLR